MTTDEINIAIAEFCGLSDFIKTDCGECYGFGLTGAEGDAGVCGCCKNGHVAPYYTGPNYHCDLNSCREAEMRLTDDQRDDFRINLMMICGGEAAYHANAPQRCEAILKTIGKWRDA